MNRVQTVTQKHHRVEYQVEKPSRVHEHPAGPTNTPRCALARPGTRTPCRIMGRPGRVVAEAPYRIAAQAAVSPSSCARPCAPCPAPLRALPRAPARRVVRVAGLHGRIVSAQAALSWVCAVRAPGRVVA